MAVIVTNVQQVGDQLVAHHSDGGIFILYSTGNDLFYSNGTSYTISKLGNQLKVQYATGQVQVAYPTGSNVWYCGPLSNGIVVPLIDTISPGHGITNPGGTVASGWSWHITNEGNRGGDDWNYSFGTPFTAPGPGTVDHFDVAGVGMVVRLTLDFPATRINGQQAAGFDQFGPMTVVHFEHCSSANDGHHLQGEVIGQSGDGYGAYPAHLHVHGQVNESSPSSSSNRCCFWGFV